MGTLEAVELWVGRLGGLAGLSTLTAALAALYLALTRPAGREERGARLFLRAILALAVGLFLGAGL